MEHELPTQTRGWGLHVYVRAYVWVGLCNLECRLVLLSGYSHLCILSRQLVILWTWAELTSSLSFVTFFGQPMLDIYKNQKYLFFLSSFSICLIFTLSSRLATLKPKHLSDFSPCSLQSSSAPFRCTLCSRGPSNQAPVLLLYRTKPLKFFETGFLSFFNFFHIFNIINPFSYFQKKFS